MLTKNSVTFIFIVLSLLLGGGAGADDSANNSTNNSFLSPDLQVNQARALIKKEQYSEALSLLRNKVDQQKTTSHKNDVLFLIGIAAIRLAEKKPIAEADIALKLAIASFRQILISNPKLVRVRLELAYAYFLKHDDDLAKEHFNIVLADNPSSELAVNVRRFLKEIQTRKRWGAYFSMALAPSTNINGGTENTIVYYSNFLPLRIPESSRQKSGVGVFFQGGVDYDYPISKSWRWITGVDASRREYGSSQFDSTSLFFRSGFRYLFSSASDVRLQSIVGGTWQARNRQYRSYGFRLDGSHRLSRQWYVYAASDWHKRVYRASPLLDGDYVSYSATFRYLLNSLWRIDFGGAISHDRPKSLSRHTLHWNVNMGVTRSLPRGWVVSGHIQTGETQYKARSVFIRDFAGRKDRQLTYRMGVLNQNIVIAGFSPKFSVIREETDSNSPIHENKRNLAELTFIRQF